jgi:hypothetical protein
LFSLFLHKRSLRSFICLAPVDTINAQQKLSQAQLGASQGGVNLYTGALGYNLPYKRKERLFGVFLPSFVLLYRFAGGRERTKISRKTPKRRIFRVVRLFRG